MKPQTWKILSLSAIFFLINLVLLLFHEPGLNDTLTWLYAAQFSPDPALFLGAGDLGLAAFAGPLWLCLVSILHALNLPLVSANFLTLIFATAAAALLLKNLANSPIFRQLSKNSRVLLSILFLASAALLYQTAIVSSGVALATLFLMLALNFYSRRTARPVAYLLCLIFMSLSQIYLVGLAAVLAIELLIQLLKVKKSARLNAQSAHAKTPRTAPTRPGTASLARPQKLPLPSLLLTPLLALWILVICFFTFAQSAYAALIVTSLDDFFLDYNALLLGIPLPLIELMLIFTIITFCIKSPKLCLYTIISTIILLLAAYANWLRLDFAGVNLLVIVDLWLALYLLALSEPPRRTPRRLARIELVKWSEKYLPAGLFLILPIIFTAPATLAASASELTGQYDYVSEMATFLNDLPSGKIAVAGTRQPLLAQALLPLLDENHELTVYGNDAFWQEVEAQFSTEINNTTTAASDADATDLSTVDSDATDLKATDSDATAETGATPTTDASSASANFYLITDAVTCGNDNALDDIPESWENLAQFDSLKVYQVTSSAESSP